MVCVCFIFFHALWVSFYSDICIYFFLSVLPFFFSSSRPSVRIRVLRRPNANYTLSWGVGVPRARYCDNAVGNFTPSIGVSQDQSDGETKARRNGNSENLSRAVRVAEVSLIFRHGNSVVFDCSCVFKLLFQGDYLGVKVVDSTAHSGRKRVEFFVNDHLMHAYNDIEWNPAFVFMATPCDDCRLRITSGSCVCVASFI